MLATGDNSERATLWQVRQGKVVGAVRYFPGEHSTLSQVRLEVPEDKPK